MSGPAATVRRLVGVYDADHTIRGELTYWVGARLGRAHCSLCDITHGLVRPTQAWKDYCTALPVPFATYHRDDRPASARGLGPVPLVAAETDASTVLLLGPDALVGCDGSVDALATAVEQAVAESGLRWPG